MDLFGVGERMITAKSDPVFGGVYKLAAIEKEDGTIVPKIKISENVGKITNPHFKKVYRIFDKATGKAEADYITVWDEVIEEGQASGTVRPGCHLEAADLYGLYHQAPAGEDLRARRAGVSAAHAAGDPEVLPGADRYPVGRGKAF